jgi:hypothetical protein
MSVSKEDTIQLITYITKNMQNGRIKDSEYYRNELVEKRWKGKPIQVIWLQIYPSILDSKNKNHICISQWIDPNLEESARPLKISGEEIVDGLVIEWSSNYNELLNSFNENALSKAEYLNLVIPFRESAMNIANKIIDIFIRYCQKEITEKDYIEKIQFYYPNIHQIDQKVMYMLIANIECKDHSNKFRELIATLGNIGLLFSEEQIKSRTTENRDSLVKMYLEQFQQTHQELLYEHKKIDR